MSKSTTEASEPQEKSKNRIKRFFQPRIPWDGKPLEDHADQRVLLTPREKGFLAYE